ncbi:phosphonoacetaldehyde hydrolase [Aureimonas endophytica]|uniref:Phosphonoacetaldehyde hydrolase n=1 Tax=Aureimonas endophytica TaxID=2027858 RepID=A0A917E5H0_9HYPH|nr:phosphonoacetaldehyde hydrolase [Aureimonas endophytica]GGE04935.1 phosphonoacetaldehyde hydrolase [Aureimonas endophytica]
MSEVRAVVFDWAGTVIDFGSRAPMGVFVEAFARFGVEVSVAEARGPMGRPKWDHIAAMLAEPRIAAAWRAAQGAAPDKAAVDRIYEIFVPMNEAVVADYATLVAGAAEAVAVLRERGCRIGSTTGYTRSIMARLLPLAAAQGFSPDNLVCAGDLAEGRPSPMNMYRTFLDLGVWPAARVVKVDDTGVGIEEGVHAGCWTIGVALSGNEAGLAPDELAALPEGERQALRERAGTALRRHGAHLVIDTVADLLPAIDAIEARIARGERP